MFFLVVMYTLNTKRRFWISFILIFFTLIAALSFNSIMCFFIILILLIVSPIDNNHKYLKISLSMLIISSPCLILYFTEKLNKHNNLNNNYQKMTNFFENFFRDYLTYGSLDVREFINKTLFNPYLYEFHLIRDLMEIIIKLKN
jgi:hypothetical protein